VPGVALAGQLRACLLDAAFANTLVERQHPVVETIFLYQLTWGSAQGIRCRLDARKHPFI
jgi:hypothetical protein